MYSKRRRTIASDLEFFLNETFLKLSIYHSNNEVEKYLNRKLVVGYFFSNLNNY